MGAQATKLDAPIVLNANELLYGDIILLNFQEHLGDLSLPPDVIRECMLEGDGHLQTHDSNRFQRWTLAGIVLNHYGPRLPDGTRSIILQWAEPTPTCIQIFDFSERFEYYKKSAREIAIRRLRMDRSSEASARAKKHLQDFIDAIRGKPYDTVSHLLGPMLSRVQHTLCRLPESEEKTSDDLFDEVDEDKSGEITARELQRALTKATGTPVGWREVRATMESVGCIATSTISKEKFRRIFGLQVALSGRSLYRPEQLLAGEFVAECLALLGVLDPRKPFLSRKADGLMDMLKSAIGSAHLSAVRLMVSGSKAGNQREEAPLVDYGDEYEGVYGGDLVECAPASTPTDLPFPYTPDLFALGCRRTLALRGTFLPGEDGYPKFWGELLANFRHKIGFREAEPVPTHLAEQFVLDRVRIVRAGKEQFVQIVEDEDRAEYVERRKQDHTVKEGETLGVIAQEYGVTVRQLRQANPSVPDDKKELEPGAIVSIPARRVYVRQEWLPDREQRKKEDEMLKKLREKKQKQKHFEQKHPVLANLGDGFSRIGPL
eukprot:Rmarinus@m.30108